MVVLPQDRLTRSLRDPQNIAHVLREKEVNLRVLQATDRRSRHELEPTTSGCRYEQASQQGRRRSSVSTVAQERQPTPMARRFVRMLQQAISTKDGTRLATIIHLLSIQHAANGPPTIYTVHLAPDDHGTFLVTCREIPDLVTFGEDEEEALASAERGIRETLATGRNAPDFPC